MKLIKEYIVLYKDFSPSPFGRYRTDSDVSGEVFREDCLIPSLNKYDKITINLDKLDGIGPSFWDEAFAGLIINKYYTLDEINKKITFECSDDRFLIKHIKGFMEKANNLIKK